MDRAMRTGDPDCAVALATQVLETFVTWAERISEAGLAELSTYFGKRAEVELNPRLLPERAALATLWC